MPDEPNTPIVAGVPDDVLVERLQMLFNHKIAVSQKASDTYGGFRPIVITAEDLVFLR